MPRHLSSLRFGYAACQDRLPQGLQGPSSLPINNQKSSIIIHQSNHPPLSSHQWFSSLYLFFNIQYSIFNVLSPLTSGLWLHPLQ